MMRCPWRRVLRRASEADASRCQGLLATRSLALLDPEETRRLCRRPSYLVPFQLDRDAFGLEVRVVVVAESARRQPVP